jgi:hypothetical protein
MYEAWYVHTCVCVCVLESSFLFISIVPNYPIHSHYRPFIFMQYINPTLLIIIAD